MVFPVGVIPGGLLAVIERFLELWPSMYADLLDSIEAVDGKVDLSMQTVLDYIESTERRIYERDSSQDIQINWILGEVLTLPSLARDMIMPDVASAVNSSIRDASDTWRQDLVDQAKENARLYGTLEEKVQQFRDQSTEEARQLREELLSQYLDIEKIKADNEARRIERESRESLWEKITRFFKDPLLFILELLVGWLVDHLDDAFSYVEDALWGKV